MKNTFLWQRKSLIYLVLAALAVSWTGLSFSYSWNLDDVLIVSLCTSCLVLFVYNFDDLMDNGKIRHFVKSSKFWSLVFLGAIALIGSYSFLRIESFWASLFVVLNGIFYSRTFEIGGGKFKLKSVAWLKNILIGLGWGALVILGAGDLATTAVLIAALFLAVQVMIGSIIRDIDDVEDDRSKLVRTLPVVLGIRKTLIAAHILNAFCLLILLAALALAPEVSFLWLLWILAIVYRWITILIIDRREQNSFYLQPVNIATCGVIFLLRMVHVWITY